MRTLFYLTSSLLLKLSVSQFSAGDYGVDRPNGDMPGSPFNMSTNSTLECYNACVSTSGCAAWVSNLCVSPAQCWLKFEVPAIAFQTCRWSGTLRGLQPVTYVPLAVGTIHPEGWLLSQAKNVMNGLMSHLPEFWNDVQNSSWWNPSNKGDGGLHERGPYWLNGFIHMAYLLDDPTYINTANTYINDVLSKNQAPSGWLGPDDLSNDGNQYWGRYYMLYALIAQFEATSSKGNPDQRIITALHSFFVEMRRRLETVPLGVTWSGARYADAVEAVYWLLEHFPQGKEQELIDLAEILISQGFDWESYVTGPTFPRGNVDGKDATLYTHGVNNGQAIKSGSVKFRFSGDSLDADTVAYRMGMYDTYHGTPTGVFNCDEHLAGVFPSHGTEICTIVEIMYSYSVAFGHLGDATFAERSEQVAFNTLPASFTKNEWDHPYLHQHNEIFAGKTDPHIWVTDGDDSTIYGLEPNYGCCTANFPQGWAKFLSRALYEFPGLNGFAVSSLGPMSATLSSGHLVNISTSYPFGDDLTISVTNQPILAGFSISLRIPSWVTSSSYITVNGGAQINVLPFAGTMYSIAIPAGSSASVYFNTAPEIITKTWFNNSVSVHRGAFVYSLTFPETVTVLNTYAFNSTDVQVATPGPWNYALVVPDITQPASAFTFHRRSAPSSVPFSETNYPNVITANARLISNWGSTAFPNTADVPPKSPVDCSVVTCGPITQVTLVPHGSTLLRISEIPYVES